MRESRARVGCDCRQNVRILPGVLLWRIFMFDPEVDYPGCCVQVEWRCNYALLPSIDRLQIDSSPLSLYSSLLLSKLLEAAAFHCFTTIRLDKLYLQMSKVLITGITHLRLLFWPAIQAFPVSLDPIPNNSRLSHWVLPVHSSYASYYTSVS